MRALGRNVQPLRIDDTNLATLMAPKPTNSDTDQARAAFDSWVYNCLSAGYTLKPHTLPSGEKTQSLFRGPFCPVIPESSGVKPWAVTGGDLKVTDSTTGIIDATYSSAWNIGRALAVTDRSFSQSLLRLRGNVHEEAVKRAKTRALSMGMDVASYLKNLKESIGKLSEAHRAQGLTQSSAISRWHRSPEEMNHLPGVRLANDTNYTTHDYLTQISTVMAEFCGWQAGNSNPATGGTANATPTKDVDWLNVSSWILDRLYLAKIPLHYLVPEPESLPRESIRTFSIDPVWVESLIDGALSIGNHFNEDDDTLRREIKKNINKYLNTPLKDGPGAGTLPQIPKWGFLMRSIAVTSFQDLKIEAPLPVGSPQGLSEVLYMQLLADDVIICLFDRCPGEKTFTQIVFSQPTHQQSYACGNKLTSDTLEMEFRFLPNQPNAKLEALSLKNARLASCKKGDASSPPIYHWESRTLISTNFAKRCIKELNDPGLPNFFKWDANTRGVPSSIVASQLSRPVMQLKIPVSTSGEVVPPALITSTSPATPGARQLYIPPDPTPKATAPTKDSGGTGQRQLQVRLPVEPRPAPPVVKISKPGNSSQQPKDPGNSERKLERLDFGQQNGWLRPIRLVCYPLNQLKSKESPISPNGGRPMDIVVGMVDVVYMMAGLSYMAREIEVMFPVRMVSGEVPAGVIDSLPTMFTIEGTLENPRLPAIEPVNRGCAWLYDSRLVLSTLWDVNLRPRREFRPTGIGNIDLELRQADDDGMQDKYYPRPAEKALQLMLVVRLKPRLNSNVISGDKARGFDGTFLLKGLRVTTPTNTGSGGDRIEVEYSVMMRHYSWYRRDGAQAGKVSIAYK